MWVEKGCYLLPYSIPKTKAPKSFETSATLRRKLHNMLPQTSRLPQAVFVPYCPLYRADGRQCACANTEEVFVVTVIMYCVGKLRGLL